MTGEWQNIASLRSSSGGNTSSSVSQPILSDVGILTYQGYVNPTDIQDFVVAGEQGQDNTDGSLTFKFKMPYNGWVLGYSITGKTDSPMQIGSYISRLNVDGTGTDIIHVDPSTLPAKQLNPAGINYVASSPPPVAKDQSVAMKLNFGNNNGGQAGNILAFGYLHLQYDAASVSQTASLQDNFTYSPSTTTSSTETDVAILDLGHYYCKDGEAPVGQQNAKQFQDTYIDANDGTVASVNNSRFAPFDCYITSAAICQQNSLSTSVYVDIQTAGGNFTLGVGSGQAHTEQTFGAQQYYVAQGGYFYANAYADSSESGGALELSCLLTLTPAASNQ